MIFEKINLNRSYGIKIRVLHRIENIFYDSYITIFNPNQVFQRCLFDTQSKALRKYQDIPSPVFASDKELDEIADFLSTVLVVQKGYYQ
jgi:hypothetical protein